MNLLGVGRANSLGAGERVSPGSDQQPRRLPGAAGARGHVASGAVAADGAV